VARIAEMAGPVIKPYGSWESPITAESITKSSTAMGSVGCISDGTLYWMEARPLEAGRNVLCRQATSKEVEEGKASERGGIDVMPAGTNARTLVHEYGGKSHLLMNDGSFVYCEMKTQRLKLVRQDGTTVELTPPSAYEKDMQYRFADLHLDTKRKRLVCLREDLTTSGALNTIATICAIPLDGSGKMEVLVTGCDFYVAPKVSPDGSKLAYICWNHPKMPWDATELHVVGLGEAGAVQGETKIVCGRHGGDVAVLQPAWSPAGDLHFVCDKTGWWNLYKCDAEGTITNMMPMDAEFSGPFPGWMVGAQNYSFLGERDVVIVYKRRDTGADQLVVIRESGPKEYGHEVVFKTWPHNIGGMVVSPDGKTLYFKGDDPKAPGSVYSWAIPDAGSPGDPVAPQKIINSSAIDFDVDFLSEPELICFPTPDANGKEVAYGYYYPPKNAKFAAPEGSKPPLLVQCHGGPTASAVATFSVSTQYWTSRGFALLDVDYRGSTGYGRQFAQRQKKEFGVVDVEDVCAGALHLVAQGLVHADELAISGGSAGGYTVLSALTFKSVFKAGTSLFGIGNLRTLAEGANKLESHYLNGLVGDPQLEETQKIFDERSPIKHTDKLACPVLLLHGTEDACVPPDQSETMYAALKAKGIPCALKMYEGEQHGFRKAENITDAQNREYAFYARVFGFEAIGVPEIEVANL
jgi:dipeptidyl aminopeptidase/acylaminoacyl peptidase